MRQIAFCLLLAMLGTTTLYARLKGQEKIDSLLKELPRQKDDSARVIVLYALSYSYAAISPDESLKYSRQGIELATKLDWKAKMANFNDVLGGNYQVISDFPKALESFLKAKKLYEFIGDKKGMAGATCNIGIFYIRQKNHQKALEYFFEALKLDEEGGYKKFAAIVTGNIGAVYHEQKDYPKALEYGFKSLKLYEELGYKHGIAGVTGNIGNVYKDQKNYTMAVAYLQAALKLNEEPGNSDQLADNLCNLGGTYLAIIQDSATNWGMVTGTTELREAAYVPTFSIPKGKAALLSAAIDCLKRALELYKEIKALDRMLECYSGLTEAYKLKGDYRKVVDYIDSTRVIVDSIFSQENRDKIAKLEDAHKQYGDSLKAATAQKAADVKAATRRNYELIGGGVLLLALGFIFVLRKNNKLLGKEKKQNEDLLLNILPEEVASQLKNTGKSAAKQFDNVTVLFTDFVNFTEASERLSPEALIEELDACFKAFDEITSKYNIEKIKTIGDAYLAVAGLPTEDPKHAENALKTAVEIIAYMDNRLAKLGSERTFRIRIGLHSGSVVAGIVGLKKFAYDIWGDTVNTAARMEQYSEAGKINISETIYELVKDKFNCEYRGEVEVKGKGVMKMYYVR